ncbi:MAG: lytic transglycosylase domain-containing protein [Desulfobacteraceae bacterium]
MDDDSFVTSLPAKLLGILGTGILLVPLIAFTLLNNGPISTDGWKTQQREQEQRPILYRGVPEQDLGQEKVKIDSSPSKFQEFDPVITRVAHHHQVDPALVKAVVMAESGFDPLAVSSQGAEGLMQLMPRTARALGVKDTFNPEHNIDGGVRYLKSLIGKFDNNIRYALAAYNAGSSRVKKHNGVPPFPATRIYIEKVFTYYHYYKDKIRYTTAGA